MGQKQKGIRQNERQGYRQKNKSEEEVEEDRREYEYTALFHAVGDVEFLRRFTIREYLSRHVIVKQPDERCGELQWAA